jgi:mRNA interferase RelE/StbE
LIYNVLWSEESIKNLQKIDKSIAKKIKEKIINYLAKDPINLGKPLTGDFKNLYRYRFNNFRIIYAINKNEIIISILKIGHRKDIYENSL